MSSLQCWVKSVSSVSTSLLFWDTTWIFFLICVWNEIQRMIFHSGLFQISFQYWPLYFTLAVSWQKNVYQSPLLELCLILVGLCAPWGNLQTPDCCLLCCFCLCGEMKCTLSTRWSVCGGWLNQYRQRVCSLWSLSLHFLECHQRFPSLQAHPSRGNPNIVLRAADTCRDKGDWECHPPAI